MKTLYLLLFLAYVTAVSAQNIYYPPYSSNFENYATEADFLNDWTNANPANDEGTWLFDYTGYFGVNYSNAPLYATDNIYNANDWLVSPGFFLEENKTYKLDFNYTALGNNYYEKLKLFSGASTNPDSLTTLIFDFGSFTTTSNGHTFDFFSNEITIPSDGVYYFGFYAYSNAGNMGIAFDNFDLSIQTKIRNDFNDNEIIVYPSLVQNYLHIENVQNAIINLYSIEGQLLNSFYEKNLNTSIDLSNISAGIYIVKIFKDSQVITKKIYHY